MLELEEAQEKILAAIPPPAVERAALADAHGRILAGTITSPLDLPVFDNSAVDGYAVRAADTAAARADHPVHLKLIGRIAAGEAGAGELTAGTSVRVFTGSPLPPGADAVVMQEDTRMELARPGEVEVLEPAKPWDGVRFRGEDVKRGSSLVAVGDPLTAGRIALLAAVGVAELQVGRRPIVGLLATGSELKSAGEPLAPGKIYESNRLSLTPLIRRAGGEVRAYPIVPDELSATRAALERAFAECDVVVTCGGVSVGEMDFVRTAFEQNGGRLEFWKVAIKPGRPFVFGRLAKKFLFGLPGNPVSAFVTFLLLVHPALLRHQGASDATLPSHPGVLAEPLANPGGRRHFMRVIADGAGNVRSSGLQGSHILSSLSAANGLVDVPPKTTVAAGEIVRVLSWE